MVPCKLHLRVIEVLLVFLVAVLRSKDQIRYCTDMYGSNGHGHGGYFLIQLEHSLVAVAQSGNSHGHREPVALNHKATKCHGLWAVAPIHVRTHISREEKRVSRYGPGYLNVAATWLSTKAWTLAEWCEFSSRHGKYLRGRTLALATASGSGDSFYTAS
ncbi:hypothetical protein C8R44DRAFT_746372 [Mycena epipterygia]|nr:hypothetical protein C8R44DRAFT_746372 [Mycena epipterygia]